MVLAEIINRPVFMWEMLPMALLILLVAVYLWDSRLQASRRIMGRLSGEAGKKQLSHRKASLS